MTLFSRRKFLLTATASTLAAPALAKTDWVMPEEYKPTVIRLRTKLEPGEIHVDPGAFALYLTLEKKKALRYTVGIGRAELYERGTFTVGAKKEWPSWTPTQDMIKRNPKAYKRFEDGMPGGPNNPLGARALYLFQPGIGDTFLRIHGTSQPHTIHSAVSNGCVRLTNEHVAELYEQVPMGTKVVLH
jgi:lipoprotein-anchoring transpeptidase ErfK/SrfK